MAGSGGGEKEELLLITGSGFQFEKMKKIWRVGWEELQDTVNTHKCRQTIH